MSATTSVLLDTSFLITLIDKNRPHHATAEKYYRYMLQTELPMYFSAIVASEFAVKQSITDLPMKNFRHLHFNIPHGQTAAALWNCLGPRDEGDDRHVVRDDVKLIAQASHENIGFILTEDTSTLHNYCERLRIAGKIETHSITLKGGFDINVFNKHPQKKLDLNGNAAT